MPRSIWSGAISFGLVNVPVKLYSAVSRKSVRFHELHEPDGVRVQHRRVCPAEDREISYEEIVKGYELGPGSYVVVSSEELEALDPQKTRTIDIKDFVDLAEIDPIFYDNAYYLAPASGAAKAYNLLLQAMTEAGKVAIGRVVIRQKEHLAAIRPAGEVLTMATMLFGDEVVPPRALDELTAEEPAEASEREVAMARQLIDALTTDFDPDRYRDEYRERVLDLIERKARGEQVVSQPAPAPAAVPDLMAALEASLAAAGSVPGDAGRPGGETDAGAEGGGPSRRGGRRKATQGA
jgi:DNA end-binding protein Ku